jgi:hypothetical protein
MNKVGAFIFGAIVSGAIVFGIEEYRMKKVKKDAEDSIAQMIEVYKQKTIELETKHIDISEDLGTVEDAEKALNEYSAFGKSESVEKHDILDEPEEKKSNGEAYIIKPDDFAMDPDMEIISLIFYSGNNKLVYVSGDAGIEEHPEDLFDIEFLNHFGEYEENMLYIRDPDKKIEYDIEYDENSYVEHISGSKKR